VKRRQFPQGPSVLFVGALIAGAVGCGETKSNPGATSAQNEGGAGLEGGSGGNAQSGTGPEAPYAGAVLAMLTTRDALQTYVARAVFTLGPRPTIGGCPQCCCGSTDRGLPFPDKPPDIGEISLLPASGATPLTTLVPEVFENGGGTFHGMTDLGWSWFGPLSDYAPVSSQPWDAGDSLRVLAQGNEVEPFSALLRTSPALRGVTPPIGSSKVVVDHTRPFEISWTPEGDGDATVLLGIPNATGICYCDAPDSAGILVVDANLLSPVSGELSLARLTVSNVASGNASVDLVGASVQRGAVEVQ